MSDYELLQEGTVKQNSSYQKRYKCPYCEERMIRTKLISHIEKKHEEMIPKDYTPSRVVFNYINKKDHGSCIMCRKDTDWDENKGRYNRLCNDPKCKINYAKMSEKRLMKKTGKTRADLLNDPEFQKKMLQGRSISGYYTFSDGGKMGYTGQYEKKFLEFMDNYFNVKSEDVEQGPVIEYMYDGTTHHYLSDYIYIPYNLIIEIKDGGDNPNNREMKSYREKQIAKEKAIKKMNEYNYIRLTNNNFEQLILIMLELKEVYMDDNTDKKIIRINESTDIIDDYVLDFINEEAIYDDKNKYPIFITLMHSGTPLANVIKKFTKDEFSHACISFNHYLDPMYSFGSKKVGGLDLGLVSQNHNADFYKKYKSFYKVYVMFVDKEAYDRMQDRLEWFKRNNKKLKYDLFGLLQIAAGMDTEYKTYKYFCSRFVAELIGYGKELDKLPSLYKPQDLKDLYYISLVNGGTDFSKYNADITEKNLENIKNGDYDDTVFSEEAYGTIASAMPVDRPYDPDKVYVINYIRNNTFTGKENETALCKDLMSDIVIQDKDKKIKRISMDEFKEMTLSHEMYRYEGSLTYNQILEYVKNNDVWISDIIEERQNEFGDKLLKETSLLQKIEARLEINEATILSSLDNTNISKIKLLRYFSEYNNVNIYRDINGIFALNEITNKRSKSYKNINDIPSSVIDELLKE